MNKILMAVFVLLTALVAMSISTAQPSTMPDGATQVPPEMGVVPKRVEPPAPADLKPRMRPELKPRMKPEELRPEMRPERRPEMSPGMQPNSQKPMRPEPVPPVGGVRP